MSGWLKRILPAVAITAIVLSGVSHAEEAVLVPGATVFKQINPLYPTVAKTYPDIGIHFHDDASPQVIQYSQNALASDKAIADGVEQTIKAVREVDGPVVVIGESMGSMVAARVARELAASPDAPSKDDIRFVLIAPPEAGAAEYFKVGTYIPVLNYRVSRVPESPYDTTVVIGEYDGWADPPDRPWNLVALANAGAGIAFVHGPPISAADPATVPKENVTVVKNSAGGTVTTYFVPTEHLPLTQPLRLVGVPDKVVDRVDKVLRPIIDAGYVRHDKPGDTRAYLADGEIHRNVQSQQVQREQSAAKKPTDRPPRRNSLRKQIVSVLRQLTGKTAVRSVDRPVEPGPEPVSGESDDGPADQS
jgi:hypothetical protein